MARTLMIQGTSSNVGKSILTTGLCRLFASMGYKVAPFKSQNMALNSYVTFDGGEIGRAQGLQAEAAGIEATVHMNPILLKPSSDMNAQVIVRGKVYGNMGAVEYRKNYIDEALKISRESLDILKSQYDIVIIEGAGSPAEVNLMDRDIANMKIAEMADAPVLLVGDIDRGGIFAFFVGTLEVLPPTDRERIKGFIINKFRGIKSLLDPGITWLESRTSIPVAGIVPYTSIKLEEEDSVALSEGANSFNKEGDIRIGIVKLSRISNYTDFDPLIMERDVSIDFLDNPKNLDGYDCVIIPGTKNTIGDLQLLKDKGWDKRILSYYYNGGTVVGICGGYQMLGQSLYDPEGLEGNISKIEGLNLIPMETLFKGEKVVRRVNLKTNGLPWDSEGTLKGYEIHMGESRYQTTDVPTIFPETSRCEGVILENGRVWGTYLHGIFENDRFRRGWLNSLRAKKSLPHLPIDFSYLDNKNSVFSQLANTLQESLDIELIMKIMGLK